LDMGGKWLGVTQFIIWTEKTKKPAEAGFFV
jgi:hypothetical protein